LLKGKLHQMPMPSLALRAMFKISKLFKLTIFLSFFLPLSPLSFFLAKGGGQLPPLPPLGSALELLSQPSTVALSAQNFFRSA